MPPGGGPMKKRKIIGKKSGASKKLALTKIVKNLIDKNLEVKDRNQTYSFVNPITGVAATGFYNQIRNPNSIAQGIDDDQRIGNKIKMHHVQYSFFVKASSATAYNDAGFVALVLDTQNNGGTTANDLIYDNLLGQPLGICFKNTREWSKRFRILKTTPWVASLDTPVMIREYYSFASLPDELRITEYNDVSAASTSIVSNALYIVFVGSNVYPTSSTLSQVVGACKLSYTDA